MVEPEWTQAMIRSASRGRKPRRWLLALQHNAHNGHYGHWSVETVVHFGHGQLRNDRGMRASNEFVVGEDDEKFFEMCNFAYPSCTKALILKSLVTKNWVEF